VRRAEMPLNRGLCTSDVYIKEWSVNFENGQMGIKV
jgi:hypothetical protein